MPKVLKPFARFLLILLIVLSAIGASAQSVSDATNIDSRWNKTWPAGPYSQVSTSWGVLQTTVPLFSLKGPGGTTIGFDIYHRSNQQALSVFAPTDGGAGRGFTTSATQTIQVNGNGGFTWYQGGNATATWNLIIVNGNQTYTRAPGTRADLYPIYGPQHILTGAKVIDQDTKMEYLFMEILAPQVAFRLTFIGDRYIPSWAGYHNYINYSYDSQHRPIRITDASGVRYAQFSYSSGWGNEQLTNVTLTFPGGSRSWDFYYNNYYLDHIDFPAPVTGGPRPNIGFHYNGEANIDDVYDLMGHRWHYEYGTVFTGVLGCSACYVPYLPNPTTTWDSTGTTFSWFVTNVGSPSNWTKTCLINDRMGRTWKHVYRNDGGNDWFAAPIKETWDPAVSADAGATYHDSYDWNYSDATLASYTDRRGHTTYYTYEPGNTGLVDSKTDREGWLWQYFWANNQLWTATAPNLVNHKYEFLNPGDRLLISETVDPTYIYAPTYIYKPSAVNIKTTYNYDYAGDVTSIRKGTDTPTTFTNYDAIGDAQTVTDPAGNITTSTYDGLNNQVSVTKPSPEATTTYTYDNWSRLVRTTHPGGSYQETTYDNNGNVTLVRDENGHFKTMVYDALNRLVSSSQTVDANPLNDIVVTYGYDLNGHQTSVVNGRGKTSLYSFDERGNPMGVAYPDGTTRMSHYDANRNVDKRWNGKNDLTTYTYDWEDRLLTTTYPNGNYSTNFYRSDGLRDHYVDWNGTTQYIYNDAGLVLSVYQPVPNKTISYTYDSSGRRTTCAVGSQTWSYFYNSAYLPDHISQTVGDPTPATYTYFPNGSLQSRVNGDSTKSVYTYDTRGRVNSISHESGSVQQLVNYTYDDSNNVLSYADSSPNISVISNYTYDNANRLLRESRSSPSGTRGSVFDYQYSYDKNGNRISATRGSSVNPYVVDDNDRLASGDGYSFGAYDNDGLPASVTSSGVTKSFTYDPEGKVTQIAYSTGGSDTFGYDADGHRVEKVENGLTTRFVYDGASIVAETDASGAVTSYFIPGSGFVAGGVQHYFRENALGSNLETTNSGGSISGQTEYDAFGIEMNVLAGIKSQFRFGGNHGYYSDDRSGLRLLGARYYLPNLGRFLTQDPVGHNAGLNLYTYCECNPLSGVDPSGLEIRPLNASERVQVLATLDLMRDFDGAAQKGISRMLSEGRLLVNTDLPSDTLAETNFPIIGSQTVCLNPDIIPSDYHFKNAKAAASFLLGDRIILGGVLAHEWRHTQQSWGFVKVHPNGKERQGYTRESYFLEMARAWYWDNPIVQNKIDSRNINVQSLLKYYGGPQL